VVGKAISAQMPVDPFAIQGRWDYHGNYIKVGEFEYQYNDEKGSGYAKSKARGYVWWIWSCGPSMQPTDFWPPQITASLPVAASLYIYDPTNGTVSYGYITRTNKGILTGSNL